MSHKLTRVHLHFGGNAFNHYTRFGHPLFRKTTSKREAYDFYAEGSIFAYVRWQANDFGTRSWRLLILRSGDEFSDLYAIPGICPGADVLLDVEGKSRVLRVFEAINAIEKSQIDPADVAPYYWIEINARINTVLHPLPYTPAHHKAWKLQKEVSV